MAYENTDVGVDRSQAQIRKLLQKHGASQFTFGEATMKDGVYVACEFVIEHLRVRMRVRLKEQQGEDLTRKARRSRTKTLAEITAEAYEQEAKRVWRVIQWNIKARLVAVEEGVETLEEAFLPHLVLKGGSTIYETLRSTGRLELPDDMPLGLPAGA